MDADIFDITKHVFDRENGSWRAAYRRQKAYMRGSLRIGKLDPQLFSDRLFKLNDYLSYFPKNLGVPATSDVGYTIPSYGEPLPKDELLSILDKAKPLDWHIRMLTNGQEPSAMKEVEDAVDVYRHYYQAEQALAAIQFIKNKKNGKSKNLKKHKRQGNPASETQEGTKTTTSRKRQKQIKCYDCGKLGHVSPDCTKPKKDRRSNPQEQHHNIEEAAEVDETSLHSFDVKPEPESDVESLNLNLNSMLLTQGELNSVRTCTSEASKSTNFIPMFKNLFQKMKD